MILNCNSPVLSILGWCEKEAYSATRMEEKFASVWQITLENLAGVK